MQPTAFTIPLGETSIQGRCWEVEGARGVLVLHPATAVTQDYYAAFATYAASRGLAVVTYDYRGTGASRPASLRGYAVTMADWIDGDVPAVNAWVRARFPDLPQLAVGHSVGGHALGLADDTNQFRAALLVACHAGATRTVAGWAERQRVRFMMGWLGPLLARLLGYMPGRRLGLGEDLPRGVVLQWSRWCAQPHYFFDDPGMQAARRMARVHIPVRALSFADDPWANPVAVDMLMAGFTGTTVERVHLRPEQVGLPAIGHMGFFRRRHEAALWAPAIDWLMHYCQQEQQVHSS